MKIAIFYHSLFVLGDPPAVLPNSLGVVREQMKILGQVGLLDECKTMMCGINGGDESRETAETFLPLGAVKIFHGHRFRNECGTIRMIEEWLPGHEDWYVLYFHAKGATHPANHELSVRWRSCMTKHVILNWRRCVQDLDAGYESAGCHWMCPPATPPTQYIWAGNFWWAKASFLKTLPSIMERDRIKLSGLHSLESRYEAEVWIGNGKRQPKIKDYHSGWSPAKWAECHML